MYLLSNRVSSVLTHQSSVKSLYSPDEAEAYTYSLGYGECLTQGHECECNLEIRLQFCFREVSVSAGVREGEWA